MFKKMERKKEIRTRLKVSKSWQNCFELVLF